MKEKGIKILLAISIFLASFLMPFSVYADTVLTSDNVVGINVYTTPVSEESFTQNNVEYYKSTAIVNVEFELDQSYLGWVNIGFVIKYKGHNLSSGWTDYTKSWSGNYYVNGSVINIEVPISWNSVLSGYYMGSGHLPASSSDLQNITYSNQGSITPIGDLSTLKDILDVLNVIQQNVEIDVLTELESLVTQLGLANQYLESISNLRQWHFPFESLTFNLYLLTNNFNVVDIVDFNYWTYPMFEINKNDKIYKFTAKANQEYTFIFYVNKNIYTNRIMSEFTFQTGTYTTVSTIVNTSFGTSSAYIIKMNYINNTSSNVTDYLIYKDSLNMGTSKIIGFYAYDKDNENISTDFALNFGLSNQLLDDLHIIANGTTASDTAASGLENSNSQMASDMNDLATIESGYNDQFNDQLENIDFTNPITNNQGILPAANFVITVFNGLINNNPFSVLIIIVCILLIGKKVIGK